MSKYDSLCVFDEEDEAIGEEGPSMEEKCIVDEMTTRQPRNVENIGERIENDSSLLIAEEDISIMDFIADMVENCYIFESILSMPRSHG